MNHGNLFVFLTILVASTKSLKTQIIISSTNVTKESFKKDCLPKYDRKTECVETWRCPQLMEEFTEGPINFPWESVCNINMDFEIIYVCCEIDEVETLRTPSSHFIGPPTIYGKNQNNCGRQRVKVDYNKRIVGGVEAQLGEFPWLAWIEYEDPSGATFYACGSSLINDKWLLTAAHCIEIDEMPSAKPTRIVFGDHDLSTDPDCNERLECADSIQIVNIQRTVIHPNYMKTQVSPHDIALISLERSVQFTKYIQPICLLTEEVPETFYFWVSGWGKTLEGDLSNKKLKVAVPRSNHEKCKKIWHSVTEDQICAGGEYNKDSCQGDSGGPLMIQYNNHWYLAGIVSYGHSKCGNLDYPAVYTKVSKYINWIYATMAEDPYSQSNAKFFNFLRSFIGKLKK